ncbi:hypothetical protein CEXT_204611 [Caerostris extrusa]|uniref:Secreted protein n=1 Tax=Caerostris extrusa TaxID=172846 RepID=A0AAV4MTG3_CAEEX|nr:hypothetical protein CEXT_204611 [Caerostris extrusa]
MAKIGKRSASVLQAAVFVAIFSMHELSNPDNSNYQQRPYSDYLRYYSSKDPRLFNRNQIHYRAIIIHRHVHYLIQTILIAGMATQHSIGAF